MDEHIWASIHRLAVIAEKVQYTRFDVDTTHIKLVSVNTWNEFQQIIETSRIEGNWFFQQVRARDFDDYKEIVDRFKTPATPMGIARFQNQSFNKFFIHVHESDGGILVLQGLSSSTNSPIDVDEFYKEDTPQNMFDYLNSLITLPCQDETTVQTWNEFQRLAHASVHRQLYVCDRHAADDASYQHIISELRSMGSIQFQRQESLDFILIVDPTNRSQLVLTLRRSSTRCPVTAQDFNKTGTPQEIFEHLNQVSQRQ